MGNRRLQRTERMLQKEINELFRLQTQQMSQSVILTVTKVRMNTNLRTAKIFLSIYPSKNSTQILQIIQENKNIFKKHLGQRIGNYIKYIPELSIFIDDSIDYIEKINHLISSN